MPPDNAGSEAKKFSPSSQQGIRCEMSYPERFPPLRTWGVRASFGCFLPSLREFFVGFLTKKRVSQTPACLDIVVICVYSKDNVRNAYLVLDQSSNGVPFSLMRAVLRCSNGGRKWKFQREVL